MMISSHKLLLVMLPTPPSPRNALQVDGITINGIKIQVVNRDIVSAIVQNGVKAVFNAANSRSFTTSDGGISGALRDAMYGKGIYDMCKEIKKTQYSPDEIA